MTHFSRRLLRCGSRLRAQEEARVSGSSARAREGERLDAPQAFGLRSCSAARSMSSRLRHAPSVTGGSPDGALATGCSAGFCSALSVARSTSPRCLSGESAPSMVLRARSKGQPCPIAQCQSAARSNKSRGSALESDERDAPGRVDRVVLLGRVLAGVLEQDALAARVARGEVGEVVHLRRASRRSAERGRCGEGGQLSLCSRACGLRG